MYMCVSFDFSYSAARGELGEHTLFGVHYGREWLIDARYRHHDAEEMDLAPAHPHHEAHEPDVLNCPCRSAVQSCLLCSQQIHSRALL